MSYRTQNIETGEYISEDWIIKPVTISTGLITGYTDKIPISELGTTKFEITFGTQNEDGVYEASSRTKYTTPYSF